MSKNKNFILLSSILGGVFLFSGFVMAVTNTDYDLTIFDESSLSKINKLDLIPDDFEGSTRVVLSDFDADGKKDLVVSYGEDGRSKIKIFSAEGNLINSWYPYPEGFEGVVSVVAADLDNDGRDEVITGAGAGGGPQVRVFDWLAGTPFGVGFFAYDLDYRDGIEVGVGDIDGDGTKEILVSALNSDGGEVRFFDRFGKQVDSGFEFELENKFEPVKINAIDIGADGIDEILLAAGSGNKPMVKVFRKDGSLVREFLAYGEGFLGGFNFSTINKSGNKVIITGAGFSGGPHIRFFDVEGNLLKDEVFFSYDESFRGGVNVAVGDVVGGSSLEVVTIPQRISLENSKFTYKYIDIDISEQRLRYYQNGKLVNTFLISSGRWDMPTPYGEFKILNKHPRAYSASYNLFMPYWMSFKPKYGLHELPEWSNGAKEGASHLGLRVSHGCVRLGVGAAKALYDWTPLGTPVIIHQ